MKKVIFSFITIVAMVINAQAQSMSELKQYERGRVTAEVTTVNVARSRYTSFGKCELKKDGNFLYGRYSQSFSDRSDFNGTKDNISIKIDLRTAETTLTLNSWGGGREVYYPKVQPNGKLLVATSDDRSVIISLDKILQSID